MGGVVSGWWWSPTEVDLVHYNAEPRPSLLQGNPCSADIQTLFTIIVYLLGYALDNLVAKASLAKIRLCAAVHAIN